MAHNFPYASTPGRTAAVGLRGALLEAGLPVVDETLGRLQVRSIEHGPTVMPRSDNSAPGGEVGEHGLVRLPAVRELHRDAQVDRFRGGVGVQQVGYARPGDHHAGVAVP